MKGTQKYNKMSDQTKFVLATTVFRAQSRLYHIILSSSMSPALLGLQFYKINMIILTILGVK